MIAFAKYHGCGNNFILVREADAAGLDYSSLAVSMCNMATGIGADGLIIVREEPELEMVFYNMDGSRAPMCGNGIRCFAAYCYDRGIRTEKEYPVKTLAGEMVVHMRKTDPFMVEISMGKPSFFSRDFGVLDGSETFLNQTLETTEGPFTVSSCFMGTVHTVVWVEEFPSENAARQLSNHPVFSEKTNVNFVKRIDSATLEIKTYERGVGFTFACGTGACASQVFGIREGKTGDRVTVRLPYGHLVITQLEDGEITMAGPAVRVAEGTYIQEENEHDNRLNGSSHHSVS